MDKRPAISVVVPFHWMENWPYFLTRCLGSIERQTFKDYEVLLTKAGSMPVNTNEAIKRARGELIKILYMDDYLAHENVLQGIVDSFKGQWLVSGCEHTADGVVTYNPHLPSTEGLYRNENSIGSPSVLTIKNDEPPLFDEKLSWMLDVDYYKRMLNLYGPPICLNSIDVVIGVGSHQMTNLLTDEQKLEEVNYIKTK